jgi:hypothetical protein
MTKMFSTGSGQSVGQWYFKSQPARGVHAGRGRKDEEKEVDRRQLLVAIKDELKNEKSAKDISVELAKQSGWNKKDVYRMINQIG